MVKSLNFLVKAVGPLFLKIRAILSAAPVVILIRDGKAVLLKGNVSASVLAAFTGTAHTFAIKHALITVRRSGGSAVLRFSASVPDTARQRFRNIWFSFPERKMTGV